MRVADLISEFKEMPGPSNTFPVLTLTEKNGFIPQEQRFKKRLATEDTSRYKVVRRGDIAFNPYLVWAGAVAQNTVTDAGVISPLYPTFRVRSEHDTRFVGRLLLTPPVVSMYDSIAFGSVPRRRRTSVRDFLDLPIPQVPPIEEQRRIAAVLDAADALRAKRREAIAKLDSLTQAIFIDMFGNLEATQNCRMLSIEHLADVLIGFPFKSTTFTGDESGVRICRGANVLPGRVSWKHTERVPTDIASARDRFELCRGDVLLAMDRPWITEGLKLAQVDEATAGSLLVQRVARLRALPGTPATYLYQLLRQQAFSRHCEPTETTIPHISPRDIKSYEVPAAPAELVRSFDRLSQHIECQAALLKQDESKLDTLFASLQQRAFRGEL